MDWFLCQEMAIASADPKLIPALAASVFKAMEILPACTVSLEPPPLAIAKMETIWCWRRAVQGGNLAAEGGNMKPREASDRIEIVPAATADDMAAVRMLFREYTDWLALDFATSPSDFEAEIAALPGRYAPPEGRLLLATSSGHAAGCVALHKTQPGICEMKRMYVRPAFRGLGLGRLLAEAIIAEARAMGYSTMRLDTLPRRMPEAARLYGALGFREVPPYWSNPIAGVKYFELKLTPLAAET
jgi:GNAT superfamily N-acetyltransferase